MIAGLDRIRDLLDDTGWSLTIPEVNQTLTEAELVRLLPGHCGWIVGDDPVTQTVVDAAPDLRAIIKWGVGIDNVDQSTLAARSIGFSNTPGVFGEEVADLAMAYLVCLARHVVEIDRRVRTGSWVKPCGLSLRDKRVGIVGFGNIGRAFARRVMVAGMVPVIYDPGVQALESLECGELRDWPDGVAELDFLVLTCSLTKENMHMISAPILSACKTGVRLVNVSRGALIDEVALAQALKTGQVHSAALDVFEQEPVGQTSPLMAYESVVFGSHNASNTLEACERASVTAIELLLKFLDGK